VAKRLEGDVRNAFEKATEGSGSREQLVATVRALVGELKRQGRPPEKVIIKVKQVCGLPLLTFAADTDASADISPTKQISDMVLRATIDEYYAGQQSAGPAVRRRRSPSKTE